MMKKSCVTIYHRKIKKMQFRKIKKKIFVKTSLINQKKKYKRCIYQ